MLNNLIKLKEIVLDALIILCVPSVIDGCRNYDSRIEECRDCWDEGVDGSSRNFNVCDTNKHRSDLINMMITKNTINLDREDR